MSAPSSLFGAWCACTDDLAHYILRGRALCGTRVALTDTPTRQATSALQTNAKILVDHCPKCVERNRDRWAALKTEAPGVA